MIEMIVRVYVEGVDELEQTGTGRAQLCSKLADKLDGETLNIGNPPARIVQINVDRMECVA